MNTTPKEFSNAPVTTTVPVAGPALTFTRILAVFFLVDGIWEMLRPVTFGVLTGNVSHGVIHVLLGIIGLMVAARGRVATYLTFVGILLLAVGILWFVPGATDLLVRLLNLNRNVALLNIVLGILCLVFGASSRNVRRVDSV